MSEEFSDNPVSFRQLDRIFDGLVPVIGKFVADRLAPLEARIKELEARPEMKYLGTWRADRGYSSGSCVTDAGSLWHADKLTAQRPGASPDWTLVAKRGRDGKDAVSR
jgi:hypothetical protein